MAAGSAARRRWVTRRLTLWVRMDLREIHTPLGAHQEGFEEVPSRDPSEQFEAQKMEALSAFAAGVAHDFGNMMATLAAAAEQLEGSISTDSEEARSVHRILAAARRGRQLVDRMHRLGPSSPSITDAPVHLGPILEGVATRLRRRGAVQVELTVRISAHTPAVVGTSDELKQAILNLALNAVQALPQQRGHVRLEAGPVQMTSRGDELPSAAYVEVHDNGTGMSPEVQAQAFEPFFSTRGVGLGAGLGLVAVKRTILGLGGSIELSSEEGGGTTVRLVLPEARADRSLGSAFSA